MKVEVTDNGVTLKVEWDKGHIARFNVKWLRFHCNCERCWRPFIGMYPLDKAAFDDDIKITKFCIKGDALRVDIDKDIFTDHTTFIRLEWLKKYCSCDKCLQDEISKRSMKFYDPNTLKKPSVEFESFMNEADDQTVYECIKQVVQFGFCFIRNVPDVELNFVAKVFNVKVEPNAKVTSNTNHQLFLHQDATYYEVAPGVQVFHAYKFDDCVQGGDSILKDVFQVAKKMREQYPEEFKTLTEVPVVFETKRFELEIPAYYERLQTHIAVDYNGEIVSVNWNPGVEGIMRIREEDMDRYYTAYKQFDRMLKRGENQFKFRLRTGDVLIFNNRRMTHSRDKFELNGGERHIQSCFVNIDDLKSRYVTLAVKHGDQYIATATGNGSSL